MCGDRVHVTGLQSTYVSICNNHWLALHKNKVSEASTNQTSIKLHHERQVILKELPETGKGS